MKHKNYYEILGVSEHATPDEIKSAYRSLAKQFHPDRNPGKKDAEAKFKEVSEAYEVVGDPDKRKRYDELRHYSTTGGGNEGMSYEEFMRRFGGDYRSRQDPDEFTWGFSVSNLDDLFSSLFGREKSSKRPAARSRKQSYEYRFAPETEVPAEPHPTADPFFKRKGADAYVDVNINLAQALLGSKIRVRTPSGRNVHVRIPAGTQPGAVLRIRGMGFEEASTGDLYIRTHLTLPEKLDPDQEELVRQLALKTGMRY